jgi:drug/metabolite transporter (DMT)-like permease
MATEIALGTFGPVSIAAGRLAIAALALAPVALALSGFPSWRTAQGRRFWAFAGISAVCAQAAPFALLSWGQQSIDSGLAGLCLASMPLMALILGAMALPGEALTWRKTVGVGLGFVGVAVLFSPDLFGSAPNAAGLLGQAACVAAAFCYALGAVVVTRAPAAAPLSFAAASLVISTAIMVPAALVLEEPFAAKMTWDCFGALVYLGLVPTAAGTAIMFRILSTEGAGFFSLVNYQIPVFALAYGALFLGEPLLPAFGVALAFILAGVAISQSRPRLASP